MTGIQETSHESYKNLYLTKFNFMLRWTLIFLIIAIVAGIFGFFGIAASAAYIAKVLFFIFIVLFIVSLIFGKKRPEV